MLKWLFNWWHHTADPHCLQCQAVNACESCETLRLALDHLEYSNRQLLQTVIELTKPKVEAVENKPFEVIEPIRPRFDWKQKQRELEANDREAARLAKMKEKEIAEVETKPDQFKVKIDPILDNSISELETELELEGVK